MRFRERLLVFAVTCFAGISGLSQEPKPVSPNASQTQPSAAAVMPAGTVIPTELFKSIDAKKVKPGDKIEARTTMDLLSQGQIVVPRNTRVVGHVTEAKARTKESRESRIGMAFDRILLKDGRELSLHAAVQAIGPALFVSTATEELLSPRTPSMPSSGPPDARGTMAGSARPGATPGSPFPDNSRDTSPPAPSPASGSVALDSHSQGVIGIKGLALNTADQGSLVSSDRYNVHLDGGTELILRTE